MDGWMNGWWVVIETHCNLNIYRRRAAATLRSRAPAAAAPTPKCAARSALRVSASFRGFRGEPDACLSLQLPIRSSWTIQTPIRKARRFAPLSVARKRRCSLRPARSPLRSLQWLLLRSFEREQCGSIEMTRNTFFQFFFFFFGLTCREICNFVFLMSAVGFVLDFFFCLLGFWFEFLKVYFFLFFL